MKIVHFSDLHYPKTGSKPAVLINHMIQYYAKWTQKPILIMTGDILEHPTDKLHYAEAAALLKRLTAEGFKLLLCPGNHDLKIGGYRGRRHISKNMVRFNKYFEGLLPKSANLYGDEDNDLLDFPTVHQFDEHYFIGLNSMQKKPRLARGKLGNRQLAELKILLEKIRGQSTDPVITIYLHHHPFEFPYRYLGMKLTKRISFLEAIKGVNVLLFGHYHKNERMNTFQTEYDIDCIQLSGGSVFGNHLDWVEIDTTDYSSQVIRFPV